MKPETLRKQYKEVISDYRNWAQLLHAEEYILFPKNIGTDLSLDETSLSNGEVYTILTNKAAHGGKGALVAMIHGVASETVIGVLNKISKIARKRVRTITTDLSSAMMYTARKAFPNAQLINDRFHVQRLASEAIDQLRIKYRWEVLEEENKAIGKYRAAKKQAKKDGSEIEEYRPQVMKNGETMRQIMARSKHIIMMHFTKWNNSQKLRAEILFEKYPRLKEAYDLTMELTSIFNRKISVDAARLQMAKWYDNVEKFAMDQFNSVLNTFTQHYQTILNYFEGRLTNASAESFNAKIKAFRSQFKGVGDIKFFMYRLATLYS